MQKYTDVVQDKNGNVVAGASVRISKSTGEPASIYSDNGVTAASNPMATDGNGRFYFYAANGRYNIDIMQGSVVLSSVVDVLLEDPADASPELIEGGTFRDGALENVTIDGFPSVNKPQMDQAIEDAIAAIPGGGGSGGGDVLLVDYAGLRAYTGTSKTVRLTKPGLTGLFWQDSADTASADNGGTVIVGAAGKRWKRVYDGPVYASWFGVVGGAGVDESANILAAINAMPNGGELIVSALIPSSPIYVNSAIQHEFNNLTVRFVGKLLYGPSGMIRINGGMTEIMRPGQTRQLKLRAPSTTDADGRMVLPLAVGDAAFLLVGDRITVRGENDKYGKALYKQTTTVFSIVGDDVTCADEPDQTFYDTYPSSAWPSDWTTGTTIAINAFSALTTNAVRGDIVLNVGSSVYFGVGDLVYISDTRTEADMMAPVVTTLRSQCNMEIARVVAKTDTTVTLDRALSRDFPTAWGGGVARMSPVVNSHLIVDYADWDAPQPDRKNSALALNYCDRCSIQALGVNGKAGRLGAAARVGYSFMCEIKNFNAFDAFSFNSAEGYGLTLYYSTLCSITDSRAVGGRHNYLLQTATLCRVADCYSGDDYISGIDLHGANSIDCIIENNVVTRSVNHAPGVTNGGGIRNGNTSHTIGDHNTIIRGNKIIGYVGALSAAIDISPSSRSVLVEDNTVVDSAVGFRHYKVSSSITPAQHSNRWTIQNNTFIRVAQLLDVRNWTDYSYIDELIFTGNKAIACAGSFKIQDVPKLTFQDNKHLSPVFTAGAYAFELVGIGTKLNASGNYAGGTDKGMLVQNCPGARIVRNDLGNTVSGVPVFDGGGNGSWVNVSNDDTVPTGGGGGGTVQVFNGVVPANTSTTAPIVHNNSTLDVANGYAAIDITLAVTAGQKVYLEGVIPYLSLTGTTGPVTAALFVDGTPVGATTCRVTNGGSSGNGIIVPAVFTPGATGNVNVKMMVGPDVNTNSILLNSKFNGLSQPFLAVRT